MKKLVCLILALLLFSAPLTVRAAEEKVPAVSATVTEPATEPTQPNTVDPLSEKPAKEGDECL